MRSFMGRDILSLKDFERQEFFRVFEIAEQLEPIARSRRRLVVDDGHLPLPVVPRLLVGYQISHKSSDIDPAGRSGIEDRAPCRRVSYDVLRG